MYDLRENSGSSTNNPGPSPARPELPTRPRHEPEDDEQRRGAGHWIAIVVLALAIGVLCWYGYPSLKQVPGMLAKFPALQNSLETMNARLSGAEDQLKAWTGRQDKFQADLAQVEQNVASHLKNVRKQIQDSSDKLYQRVHGEVVAQRQVTDSELASLRSASEADRANMEKLQTELAALREQADRQAAELHNVQNQAEHDGATRDQQLASLNQQVTRDSRSLEGINDKLAVKRVDFEVSRNHSQQLTDDLSLGVTGTDVSHRRVTGWMWIMADRRTIWLRGQSAQEPVVFYGVHDGKRRELVITNVARNSVAGYVLLPADAASSPAAALSKGD